MRQRGGGVLFPRGYRLAQFGKEGAFPLVWLKDAQVGHPVAHDGQQLLRVVDAGGNQQAAVGVLLRALPGQQRALLEVAGDGGSGAQFDGEGVGGEPDVALAGEVVQMTTLAAEGGGVDDLQGADGGEAEDFELLAAFFQGGEIPDAVFVDELIGVRVARFVAVGKAAGVTVLYGALQFGEDWGGDVFFGDGLYVQAAFVGGGFQLADEPGQGGIGEDCLHASHACVLVEIDGGDGAARSADKLPAVGGAFDDARQPLAEVALDGANVYAKLPGELGFVQRLALVQTREDVRDALRELAGLASRLTLRWGGGVKRGRSMARPVTISLFGGRR